jgi:hypothetical protein
MLFSSVEQVSGIVFPRQDPTLLTNKNINAIHAILHPYRNGQINLNYHGDYTHTVLFSKKKLVKVPNSCSNAFIQVSITILIHILLGQWRIRFRNKYFYCVSTGLSAPYNKKSFSKMSTIGLFILFATVYTADYSIYELLTTKYLTKSWKNTLSK